MRSVTVASCALVALCLMAGANAREVRSTAGSALKPLIEPYNEVATRKTHKFMAFDQI